MGVAGANDVKFLCSDVHAHVNYSQIKFRGKVVTDLMRNIPVLSDTEPDRVFKFLVRAREVYDLNLVTDAEFLALLVARTTGRIMQIISVHLRAPKSCLSSFRPYSRRVLSKYVLDRFQAVTEELS